MNTATKKLTILVETDMYFALHKQVGRGNIGRFLIDNARPVLKGEAALRSSYKAMAKDEDREREAREWSDSVTADSYVA